MMHIRKLIRLGYYLPLVIILFLVACGADEGENGPDAAQTAGADQAVASLTAVITPTIPSIDLTVLDEEVGISPMPVRAGFPFTITAVIHNNLPIVALDVPVMFHVSSKQEMIGYTPFMEMISVTVPASQSLEVDLPVAWNLPGGEHRLWIQANRLPSAWRARSPTQPEEDTTDNIGLLDVMVDPFDAYLSDLCAGRVDVEIAPFDVLPEPDGGRILVRVHNTGNRAVYNLPVIVTGDQLMGIAYTPAIPPCGGMAEVYVYVDRALEEGESLAIQVNPQGWEDALQEDRFDNNQVSVAAGLAPGLVAPPGSGLEEYDFGITLDDIEIPEAWILLVTVANRGTRDAANVPIRIENEAGRKITDAIPTVGGEGLGVAAFPVGYLWTRGGILTITINPEDEAGAYPETNRANNVATFKLP